MSIPDVAAAFLHQADASFLNNDFDRALDLFTQAIVASPGCAEPFVHRAALHIKLRNFESAIYDANNALAIDKSNSKAQLRRGIAYFHLKRYAIAKAAMKNIESDDTLVRKWIQKCDAGLGKTARDEARSLAHAAGSAASVLTPVPAPIPTPCPNEGISQEHILQGTTGSFQCRKSS